MKFDDIKTRWQGYSARKKWTIAGIGAVLCIAAAGGDRNQRDGGRSDATGYAAAGGAPGYRQQPGYAGQGQDGPGDGSPAYVGGGAPASGSASAGGSVDIMSGWQHNQEVQDRAARAFDQNIRDESTIRSNTDGQVYSGVSNPVADGAVESGAAVQVPTAELPTTTTTSEPEQ
ncbi:hypothetical protein [Sphingomonas echinoides]|uniref:Uncharacterized protein n=1 Tax=Sphingomonas echinoides TaxID=59803 RepID=A0ABU4PHK9_9SPHN|nr:hypothetical protein [Sphingomonas echinoides]MDX5983681.1 hypothetical protein [Sphingomonas echinoides]